MRRSALVLAMCLVLPLVALTAGAACEVATLSQYPDINYVTVCALDEGGFGDGTQQFDHDYLLHVRHAAEADPAFTFWEANVARGTWTYDDGEVRQERAWSDIGSGLFVGAHGLVGTGYQFDLNQRDQTAGEDAAGWCSGFVGRSTCAGASGWFTVAGVAGVGAGTYYHQAGEGPDCQEQAEVDLTLLVVFVPVVSDPQPCSAEAPWLYDEGFWDALPRL